METELTFADVKGQLSALADVREAAILEAHPEPKWWMPFVAGLVGPFAVAVQVVDGYLELALVAMMLGVLAVSAFFELKHTRVRRGAFSMPRNVKISNGVFVLALSIGTFAIAPLREMMNDLLLGGVAYLVCVMLFRLWGAYMSRVIAQCRRTAAS